MPIRRTETCFRAGTADKTLTVGPPKSMKTKEHRIERRWVIEAYAQYDCSKKDHPLLDFPRWDWTKADAIDQELRRACLKSGVLAGYKLWDRVELTVADLRNCAVLAKLFPGDARPLGLIDPERLRSWRPNRDTGWYPAIVGGTALNEAEPLILRPALSSEAPAEWYVEDGSGRAITLVANAARFSDSMSVAVAYVGQEPDEASSFMRQAQFKELLAQKGGPTSR